VCCSACAQELVAGLLRPRLFPFGKLSKLKSAAQHCIEEVPQVHYSIQCKFKLEFFNWFQLEFKLRIDVETQRAV
jgi:hypothetical protein